MRALASTLAPFFKSVSIRGGLGQIARGLGQALPLAAFNPTLDIFERLQDFRHPQGERLSRTNDEALPNLLNSLRGSFG
jgi:hypothetical protein